MNQYKQHNKQRKTQNEIKQDKNETNNETITHKTIKNQSTNKCNEWSIKQLRTNTYKANKKIRMGNK